MTSYCSRAVLHYTVIESAIQANGFAVKKYRYTIILQPEPDEGGYSVTVPALPGCVAQGETLEEAIALAKEAIALHVTGLIEEGEAVPEEAEPLQALTVDVAA
jgi:antitoxin HicB